MIGVGVDVEVGNGVAEGVAVGTGVGVNVTAIIVGGTVGESLGEGTSSDCVGVTNEETGVGVGCGAAGANNVHHTHKTSPNKIHAKTNTPMMMGKFRCIIAPPKAIPRK
jgi:hypothetical protein